MKQNSNPSLTTLWQWENGRRKINLNGLYFREIFLKRSQEPRIKTGPFKDSKNVRGKTAREVCWMSRCVSLWYTKKISSAKICAFSALLRVTFHHTTRKRNSMSLVFQLQIARKINLSVSLFIIPLFLSVVCCSHALRYRSRRRLLLRYAPCFTLFRFTSCVALCLILGSNP